MRIDRRRQGTHSARLLAVLMTTGLALQVGCASVPKRHPLPHHLVNDAKISGMTEVRRWGDAEPEFAQRWFATPQEEMKAQFSGIYGRRHTYLAISGGGENGAYGAGLLVGWTEAGDRPKFTMVTGISAGALMAPFVFLGPKYDGVLEEIFTTYSTKDIVKKRGLLATISSDASYNSEPLQKLLKHYITTQVMDQIAAEHHKGRRLFIGTANLDSMRPVTWNIGAIAASGDPNALPLIRQVLLASASIPAIFPPVLIKVEVNGQSYEELHVDGGTTAQVFLYPVDLDWKRVMKKLDVPARPEVYIIRNSRMAPEWEEVDNKIFPIASRSISSLIHTQGIGDLYQIYLSTQRDKLNFNLAYIPDNFQAKSTELFDPVYMKKLFELGRSQAKAGYPWKKNLDD